MKHNLLIAVLIAAAAVSCGKMPKDMILNQLFKNNIAIKPASGESLDELMPVIKKNSKPALHLTSGNNGKFSKLGGLPETPAGFSWPQWKGKPLAFLAQLKFSEINPKGLLEDYPSSGLMYVFYDQEQTTWGFDPADRGSWKVIFFRDEKLIPEKTGAPAGLEVIYKEKHVSASKITTYRQNLSDNGKEIKLSETQWEEYYDLIDGVFAGSPDHIIGGCPYPIQNDDMEYQCELTSSGLYTGNSSGYDSLKAEKLKETSKQWKLLIQIDSDDDCEMMWGDAGMLYFFIKQDDLKNGKFDNVWMVLQCG